MTRPSDYVDSSSSPEPEDSGSAGVTLPKLGFIGTLRFAWRQLTSMRTALLLLLLLAIAAVPGSLVPQRSSDPNGVVQYFRDNPDLAPILDKIQMFDVYSSAWFSAIYLLLFISLIGCIVPRTKHHFQAMRSRPPRTPARLSRLSVHREQTLAGGSAGEAVDAARALLKKSGYRTELYQGRNGEVSVSAERGYLRETGNLVFHSALVLILVAVGFGGGLGYAGQKVVVVGQTFVNSLVDFNSFNPGRFLDSDTLAPYSLKVDDFKVEYEMKNRDAYGQAIDYTAYLTARHSDGRESKEQIKVNQPLRIEGTNVYLLGNGYAPKITVRDPEGVVKFTDSIPFLPQDTNLTSQGVIKVPDGLAEQIGMVGFFYPTAVQLDSGAYTSNFPDLVYPMLTLNVYSGDLGINDGAPKSVYSLDTDKMTEIAGRTIAKDGGPEPIKLMPGQTAELPDGLGTVTFENIDPNATDEDFSSSVARFVSLDIHRDPTQAWVATFGALILLGLLASLFVPRRRVWVKATDTEEGTVRVEYAGLARGEDPGLREAVDVIAQRHLGALGAEQEK
ncbi:cytochrome c biogenesis protein ResB [Mycetocola spongiae]|uniref:cytochrome c biogenesis protein ResB n=1 Tax=Mycetocola spongiae TaxID=2859226 RepID=UPI001CF5F138|nr:cytochrome c biogenesis protein ResB [Mycetocola spongiae]UCR87986.1 cytochrome c biogenesis protein ResB [Mycetocola spongiae]